MLVRKDENQDFWTTFNKQTDCKRFDLVSISQEHFPQDITMMKDLEERKLAQLSRAAQNFVISR